MLNDSKGALASLGVWGGVISALPAFDAILVALRIFPFPVLGELSNLLVPAIGGVIAVIGRVTAEKKITKLI
jgi:hypothetical protein